MLVCESTLSEAASRLEKERERDFFRLLYIVDRARLFLSVPVSNVDWKLACDCLDEMNYRYADFAFLLGFAATYVLRNRAGRGFFSRFRLPLYAGCVMYDLELRTATPAPALQFWNSICTMDSEVGRIARVLYTPDGFYEVAARNQKEHSAGPSATAFSSAAPSFFEWLRADVRYMTESLLLRRLGSSVFGGSCWRHRTDEKTEMTALVLNNRLFTWRLLEMCRVQESERTEYRIGLKGLPTFAASESIRRSYQCRDLIMERAPLAGKLWYKAYFTLLRCFGLEPA